MPIKFITKNINNEISNDLEGKLFKNENNKPLKTEEIRKKFIEEIAKTQKNILNSTIQLKESEDELKKRENSLKNEISIKFNGIPEKLLKEYILHMQNQEIISYLTDYKKSLSIKKPILLPQLGTSQDSAPLAEKSKKLLNDLQKLNVLINYAEGAKLRTDKFSQNQIFPMKNMVCELANLISKNTRQLLIEIQIIKSVQYLQRKLYIQSNSEIFSEERDRDLFLNGAFFYNRTKNLSNFY